MRRFILTFTAAALVATLSVTASVRAQPPEFNDPAPSGYYNPFTRESGPTALAPFAFTGRDTNGEFVFSPFTNRYEATKNYYNQYTGKAEQFYQYYNPYTGEFYSGTKELP
jgi:hypothetical protein